MINLNKVKFTPGVIAISALFIPALICGAVYLFFDFSVDFLVGLLISLCVYLCILLLFWILSNAQDRMLIPKEESLQVINPKVVNGVDRGDICNYKGILAQRSDVDEKRKNPFDALLEVLAQQLSDVEA